MNTLKVSSNKNEYGFTLVEVLASLVIISIILLGAFNLIIFTNEAAVSNNNRLVAINLGSATLERLKADPTVYFTPTQDKSNFKKVIDFDSCEMDNMDNCEDLYRVLLNDKWYDITITFMQDYAADNNTEKELGLYEVIVKVELIDENIKHEVEGYVTYGSG